MKRFHSPLEKIHDVCFQQARMAELELARAKGAWDGAVDRERSAELSLEEARDALDRSLRQQTQIGLLRGAQERVNVSAEQVVEARIQASEFQQTYQLAKKVYQDLKSRAEGLAKLIEQQQLEHRQEQFLDQQNAMDDVSAGRWARVRQYAS